MYGYVYLTTNLINNKKYIGKRAKSEFDDSYLGSGKLLKRALRKYGKINFKCEVLKWCSSLTELNESEKYFIKKFNAQERNDFYNISSGGDWGDITRGMSNKEYEEWKRKISPIGRKHSDETKEKISRAHMGKKYSPETIEKFKIANAGKNNPNYGKRQTQTHKDAMKKFRKNVVVIFPSSKRIEFESVTACKEYMKDKYNFSSYLVKRLLREGTPLNLPENERYIYPHVYKMNGTKIMYMNMEEQF